MVSEGESEVREVDMMDYLEDRKVSSLSRTQGMRNKRMEEEHSYANIGFIEEFVSYISTHKRHDYYTVLAKTNVVANIEAQSKAHLLQHIRQISFNNLIPAPLRAPSNMLLIQPCLFNQAC